MMAKKKAIAKKTPSAAKVTEELSPLDFKLNNQIYTLQVHNFIYRGKKYDSVEAVKDHKDILKELVEANSFIFKKK